jgi:DNA-binding response OmpR family regulator
LSIVSAGHIEQPYIFVVEDDANMIEILKHYIGKQGVEIDVVLNEQTVY